MQIPTTRLFTAGDNLSGAIMNQTVTSLGNFLLGKPICQLTATGSQTAWAAGTAAVLFNAETIDRDNGHSTSTNTSRYTANTPGWYRINGQAYFTGNTTGNSRYVFIRKNGTTTIADSASRLQSTSLPAGSVAVQTSPCLVYMNGTGDYIELMAGHDATASIGLAAPLANQGQTMLAIEWVSL